MRKLGLHEVEDLARGTWLVGGRAGVGTQVPEPASHKPAPRQEARIFTLAHIVKPQRRPALPAAVPFVLSIFTRKEGGRCWRGGGDVACG